MSFGSFFKKIGHGLSKIGKGIGHGLSKVGKGIYNKALKPLYTKVIKPVGKGIYRIGSKAASKGEDYVEGGIDFSSNLVDKGRGTLSNVADGAMNLSGFLKNPLVMIGAGLVVLVVVTKI
jgi:hypothetical protein